VDLFEAFGFGPGVIVAAVGGGGKTSLVYTLANEAAGRGLAAAVTTTVRFTRPRGIAMPPCIQTTAEGLNAAFASEMRPGEARTFISAEVEAGRMAGFSTEVVDGLPRGEHVLAIEADGSAHRPFKAPAAHEPAIPTSTTDVVVCVGLSVLGHPLSDNWVHRPGLVSDLANVATGAPVTADVIVETLLHAEGGRKCVPAGARLHALLNRPLTPEHHTIANHIAARLVYGGYNTAVIATAHEPGAIHGVVR
jgi:probable selenium-dependent hydroxylase accessory protein YqeC